MSRDNTQVIEILDKCLQRMRAGEGLDEVLTSYPGNVDELMPLLLAAQEAYSLRTDGSNSIRAQTRSRTRFLTTASQKRQSLRNSLGFFPMITWRLAVIPIMAGFIIITSLYGIGLSTAKALPGDTFYAMKVAIEQTRLNLAPNTTSHLHLEESFDKNRITEVLSLIKEGRDQPVDFAGFLNQNENNSWEVAGIPVVFDNANNYPLHDLIGTYVTIQGVTSKDQVDVKNLELRLFHLSGVIEDIQPNQWKVNGVPVTIESNTYIQGTPLPGSQVDITAVRPQTDRLQAILVRIAGFMPAKSKVITPTDVSPKP
jgi:hypothetical protein